MKRMIRELKNSTGTMALLVSGVNLLPFVGIGLLTCATTFSTVFGLIFLILGLFMWTLSL